MSNPNPQFQAKVIARSENSLGVAITTIQLLYPRMIHAEVMTHRMFSRNASSSRAIPVAKMIEQVLNNPAMPIHWGANQPGMQASAELPYTDEVIRSWKGAARQAAATAERMAALGLHKQVANRVLEPFQLISVIVTATEWDNFFALRRHPDAQPEIQLLSDLMYEEMTNTDVPLVIREDTNADSSLAWHLPYISEEERALYRTNILLKASTARCARVSYNNHDGSNPDFIKDVALHDALVGGEPIHASPTEHQALAVDSRNFFKNFRGWSQYRYNVERQGRDVPA